MFGLGGQGIKIKGCCVNGVSGYGIFACQAVDSINERILHFPTSYQILSETFNFLDNGTYIRNTFENTVNPAPDESDFCGTGPGVVKDVIKHVHYTGNWSLSPVAVPPEVNIYNPGGGPRHNLRLQGTSSTGSGFGNPGGLLHFVNSIGNTCDGLYIVQFDLEGGNGHLYKFYTRRSTLFWYPFDD